MVMSTKRNKLMPMTENSAKWYSQVVQYAELAEHSPVRGCMIIRPYGYAIWEVIQRNLDKRIKSAGVENAYFPIFIPKSFLSREAKHVKGFAKECAVVTHYRLKEDARGEDVVIDPEAKLEEELVLRPTSETIIYDAFSRWIKSWRDLPLNINQWANIVRWEKRTRPFLRTSEFLWQEGHTAHATKDEAAKEVARALKMYHDLAKDLLAIPTTMGYKTESEKFAGADYTTTIEALLRDKKALQSGTSHMLGQNFSKSFNVKFVGRDNKEHYVWQTSWGLSTRIIGGVILMHGDDKGLVLPPKVAPIQVIIVPIWKDKEQRFFVEEFVENIKRQIGSKVRLKIDWREESPGWKFNEWEMKGVPLRFEVGPKDVKKGSVFAAFRHTGEKKSIKVDKDFTATVMQILEDIHNQMYERAVEFVEENTHYVETYDEFKTVASDKGGYVQAFFCGDSKEEELIKNETKFSTRCIPMKTYEKLGPCIKCGKEGHLTNFARAY